MAPVAFWMVEKLLGGHGCLHGVAVVLRMVVLDEEGFWDVLDADLVDVMDVVDVAAYKEHKLELVAMQST